MAKIFQAIFLIVFFLSGLQASITQSHADLTPEEFDDYAHLSLGADVFPYDWWIRLKSARERDLRHDWKISIPQQLDERASMLYDRTESKYLSDVIGLSVTWSGQGPENPEALKSDPETAKTKVGTPAQIRYVNGAPSIRMLGTSCAACHTGNLQTPTSNIIIPGGQSNLSLDWLLRDMVISTLALLIDFEGQLADFLVTFGYERSEAVMLAKNFKKTTLRETRLTTKLVLAAKKFGIIQNVPTHKFVPEETNIANRLKALLRLTLHFSEDTPLGQELDQRMEFIAKLASGTPKYTFQDHQWTKFTEVTAGYGRVDAFINAFNRILRNKNEKVSISAPVGFPPLWGIQNKYLLHYTGNTNSIVHRNIGLAVAAGALILNEEMDSTVKFDNLITLEKLTYKINSPDWEKIFQSEKPQDYKIKVTRAERGKQIFKKECSGCHTPKKVHADYIYPLYEYPLLSQKKLGTDPELSVQIIKPIHPLESDDTHPAGLYLGKTEQVLSAFFKKYSISENLQDEYSFKAYRGEQWFRDVKRDHPNSSYISRDLAGIWSTAPFLHNNSVPTLWDLLQKPNNRPKVFRIRHRDFDPNKVGLKNYSEDLEHCQQANKKDYKWDPYQCINTSIKGSSNGGHDFGTDLTDEQKFDLIEYLKVIPPYSEGRGPASTSPIEPSTPFLDEFDDIKLGIIPFIGPWLQEKDFLKHKLLTVKKWIRLAPNQMFEELRNFRPIAKLSTLPIRSFSSNNTGLVLLSKHQDIVEVLENPAAFSVRHVGYKLDPVGGYMLGTDLTEFNTIEKQWLRKLIPHTDYGRISQLIQKFTDESFSQSEALQAGSKTYRMNLVKDLARRVPSKLYEEYFGFSSTSLDAIYEWSYWIQRDTFQNPTNKKKIRNTALEKELTLLEKMNAHILKLEQALKSNGYQPIHDTVLERMLLSDEVKNGVISRDRVAMNMIGLLGASIETVQIALVKSLEFFMMNPALLSEVKSLVKNHDFETLKKYIRESLRLRPAGPLLIRYTEKDVTIAKGTSRETLIPQGTSVLLGTYSAMRDPESVPNPKTFQIDRPENAYFLFGYGHHRCAGDRLAEVELTIMMSALLQKSNLQYFNYDKKGLPFPEERWVEYQ